MNIQVHFLMPIDRHMHRCCTVTVVHLNYESLRLPYCSASAGHPKACVCGIRGLYIYIYVLYGCLARKLNTALEAVGTK